MNKKKLTLFERYLFEEIGIEFKACLFFFCILFYYAVYRLMTGHTEAGILHMTEMIFMTYGMGYVQIYLMGGFDEGDTFGVKEAVLSVICSALYTLVSVIGGWFGGNTWVTIGFFVYMLLAYFCTYLIYKFRRRIDEKLLNDDLQAFQQREGR